MNTAQMNRPSTNGRPTTESRDRTIRRISQRRVPTRASRPIRETVTKRKSISARLAAPIAASVAVVAIALFVAANWPTDVEADLRDQVWRALPVNVTPVKLSDSYEIARSYSGEIVARRKSKAGFELPGKLVRVHVAEGEHVEAADILAELDTEHLETKRRQLAARHAQAKAFLEELQAGPRVEAVAAARAGVKSLVAQADLLRIQSNRAARLLPRNAISRDEYDEVTHNYQARRAELENARHRLEELLNGTRKEQILAQRAVVDQAAAALADVGVDLRKSKLRAPYSGTISARFADEGTVVEAGTPIVELVEDSQLEAWIGVPPRFVRLLEIGAPHTITVDEMTIPVTVSGLLPAIDPATQTRTVIFAVDASARHQPVNGEIARIELEDTVQQRGAWIPASAIQRDTRGLWTGFVLKPLADDQLRDDVPADASPAFELTRHYLEVLHMQGHRVYVRGTFSGDERIVADGVHRLVAGQIVRVAN